MSETQVLLSKITALRQRLEQAQGLASEAGLAVAGLVAGDPRAQRLRSLERQVSAGYDHDALLDGSLHQLADNPARESTPLPQRLTTRARRILERGRDLLEQLRGLGEQFGSAADSPGTEKAPSRAGADETDPIGYFFQATVAMTDSTLRTVQAFPEAPSAQLRLCPGLEAILDVIAERLARLDALVQRRSQEEERVARLGGLLVELFAGRALDVKPFVALAEAILDEAQRSAPLRFLYAGPEQPERFLACHSLTVAQVAARVVRHDPELRGRPLEPVLAALVHDVGMLLVPVEVLCHPGPLDDAGRRAIEGHTRCGASLAARLLPSGAWLAEATGAHHERCDGTGYPDGLRELQLAPLPRLLALCDVYAALCAPRPHRPARETRTAMTDTLLLAEGGALDRNRAERLLTLSFYPVGSVVELADGAVGVVVATPAGRRDLSAPARPVVALLTDSEGRFLPSAEPIDLAQCDSRSIVRTLPADERAELLSRRYPELV